MYGRAAFTLVFFIFFGLGMACDGSSSVPETALADAGVDAPGGRTGAADGSPAGETPAPDDRIARLTRALDTALFDCPDRVWPETAASYRTSQVLFVSPKTKTAHLWNDQRQGPTAERPRVSEVPFGDLGPEWLSTFHVDRLFGHPTLGISLDAAARVDQILAEVGAPRWHEYAVELTLHEAFHFIGSQPRWPSPGPGGTRSIAYPERVEPRQVRAALAGSLLAHLREGRGLGAAAFWQARFTGEHAAEASAIRRTDINEGTAEYAALAGSALVEHGCGASEATLVQAMLAHLDAFLDSGSFNGGSEPYQLGLLAGLAARAQGAASAGWEARVQAGETPVQVLVGATTPTPEADDPALIARVRTAVGARNREIEVEVGPLLARMRSKDHVRLPIPSAWTAGSFRLAGFVTLVDEPGQPDVLLEYSASHRVPETGSTITVTGQTLMEGRPDACGPATRDMRIATFPTTAAVADPTGASFTVGTPEVKFSGLAATLVEDATGLTWMCPAASAPPAAAAVATAPRATAIPSPAATPPLPCDRLRWLAKPM